MNYPRVELSVMILKDNNKVLFGKRKGSQGQDEYAFPCGHLEYNESFENCILREIQKECGSIEIKDLTFQFLSNNRNYQQHHIHLNFFANWESGEPQLLKPDEYESWEWFDIENLPKPLFNMCALAIYSYNTKQDFFDFPDIQKINFSYLIQYRCNVCRRLCIPYSQNIRNEVLCKNCYDALYDITVNR